MAKFVLVEACSNAWVGDRQSTSKGKGAFSKRKGRVGIVSRIKGKELGDPGLPAFVLICIIHEFLGARSDCP